MYVIISLISWDIFAVRIIYASRGTANNAVILVEILSPVNLHVTPFIGYLLHSHFKLESEDYVRDLHTELYGIVVCVCVCVYVLSDCSVFTYTEAPLSQNLLHEIKYITYYYQVNLI